ncbi:hypothetical protein BJ878DRAFT_485926 [Calycina marina]|uniref:Transcription initiation factor IIE subunit beta n=1 Tax=Calycina marina TaxID=1763456 RepID=A0A9P7ZBU2_9HELO|nr:hypothetical protein BJ878DRAFT_485926 [Calycina marina]
MSYLERQQAAFAQSVQAVASKVAPKRTLAAPPVSAPSPAPSNTSSTSKNEESKDLKRKREPANVVFSQPAITGMGTEIGTQIQFAINYLKEKRDPKTIHDILGYLSQTYAPERARRTISDILKKHQKVKFIPDPKSKTWESGTFEHRPTINVRNKKDLIEFLQAKKDAQGIKIKDLKDGWPDCDAALHQLEAEHNILVTRQKKDNAAKMIWCDDPSLHTYIDPEFHALWNQVKLPSVDDTVRNLLAAGQKPASEDPSKRIKLPPKPKEKKKKAPRKGGRETNKHMTHLLKDFSHMKR